MDYTFLLNNTNILKYNIFKLRLKKNTLIYKINI